MESSDIVDTQTKNIFELLFRQNSIALISFVILANGYSNIYGMNELLTTIFNNMTLRLMISFILLFQILDNITNSIYYTLIMNIFLLMIEKYYKNKNGKKQNLN